MVKESDLKKIENLSVHLLRLLELFDRKIQNIEIRERYKIRAKSTYYESLIILINEVNKTKKYTILSMQHLKEIKNRINNFLRLADEFGLNQQDEINTLKGVQESVMFEI